MKGGVLILYLPSYSDIAIRRNEFEIYMAIGLPTDIVRPYNSIEFNLSDSNVYGVEFDSCAEYDHNIALPPIS